MSTITQERLSQFIIRLKGGREYLSVAGRLLWFRSEHPDWSITTTPLKIDIENGNAVFQATISDEKGNVISMATGSETARDFADNIEKAETKSIGRALVMAGYGADGCPDLDEGPRVVDSPQPSRSVRPERQAAGAGQAGPKHSPTVGTAEARMAFDDVALQHGVEFQSGEERGRMANVILGRPADCREMFSAEDWHRAAEGVGRYVAGAKAIGEGEAFDADDTLTDPFAEAEGVAA